MKPRPAVHVAHGRKKAQIKQMQQIALDGVDPFDWKILPKYHKPPVLRKGKFWLITDNEFPYDGTDLHLLFIYRDRVRFPSETVAAAWSELKEHLQWVEETYKIKSASLLMRFGDPSGTGGSVDHLHLHVISGGKKTKDGKKIKVTVGYEKKKKGGASTLRRPVTE